MSENKLADLSMDFAVNVLNLTENIKGHYSLQTNLKDVRLQSVQILGEPNMRMERRNS